MSFLYTAKEAAEEPEENGWDPDDGVAGPPWPDGFQDTPAIGVFHDEVTHRSFAGTIKDRLSLVREEFGQKYIKEMWLTTAGLHAFGYGVEHSSDFDGTSGGFDATLFRDTTIHERVNLDDDNKLVIYTMVYQSDYTVYDADAEDRVAKGEPDTYWRSRYRMIGALFLQRENSRWDSDLETWESWQVHHLDDEDDVGSNFTTLEQPTAPRDPLAGTSLSAFDFNSQDVINAHLARQLTGADSKHIFYGSIWRFWRRSVRNIFTGHELKNDLPIHLQFEDYITGVAGNPNPKFAMISRLGVYIKTPSGHSSVTLNFSTLRTGASELKIYYSHQFPSQWREVVDGITIAEGETGVLDEQSVSAYLTTNEISDFETYEDQDNVYDTIDISTDKVIIEDADADVTEGTYTIDSIDGGRLEVGALTGDGSCKFRIVRPLTQMTYSPDAGVQEQSISVPSALLNAGDPLFIWILTDADKGDSFTDGPSTGYIHNFTIDVDGSEVVFSNRSDKTRIPIGSSNRDEGRTIEFINESDT